MIPHNSPVCGTEEAAAAASVVASGWLAQGAEVDAFENEMCAFLGLPSGHAVAVASGTAALFMALHVLGAKGRRIAFPVYACAALRNAVAMVGGDEALLDVQAGTPNLDPDHARTSGADILVAPHLYGIPIDLSACAAMPVIEDCAQSLGAKIGQVYAGLQGTLGIFSFYATKLITTGGQGGMVVSRDKRLVDAARDYRQFDCRPDRVHRFNFQMTDVQAAIGRVQLHKLPEFIERRARLFAIYRDAGLDLLDVPADSPGCAPVRYRAVVRTNHPQEAIRVLAKNDVRAIVPIEDWELLGDGNAYPNALHLTKTSISLPVFPALTDEQAATIASCIKGVA